MTEKDESLRKGSRNSEQRMKEGNTIFSEVKKREVRIKS